MRLSLNLRYWKFAILVFSLFVTGTVAANAQEFPKDGGIFNGGCGRVDLFSKEGENFKIIEEAEEYARAACAEMRDSTRAEAEIAIYSYHIYCANLGGLVSYCTSTEGGDGCESITCSKASNSPPANAWFCPPPGSPSPFSLSVNCECLMPLELASELKPFSALFKNS